MNKVEYHSFFFSENVVRLESATSFKQLKNNSILDTFISLYQEEMNKVMGS